MTIERAPPARGRRPGSALARRARPDAGRRRRADRPQHRLPVADRERQGVAVARLPRRRLPTPSTSRSPGSSSTRRPRRRSSARRSDRPAKTTLAGSSASTAATSRDISIVEVVAPPARGRAAHAHAGDEHHIVLRGRVPDDAGRPRHRRGPGRLRPLGRDGPPRRRGDRGRRRSDADRQPPSGPPRGTDLGHSPLAHEFQLELGRGRTRS